MSPNLVYTWLLNLVPVISAAMAVIVKLMKLASRLTARFRQPLINGEIRSWSVTARVSVTVTVAAVAVRGENMTPPPPPMSRRSLYIYFFRRRAVCCHCRRQRSQTGRTPRFFKTYAVVKRGRRDGVWTTRISSPTVVYWSYDVISH